MPGLYVAIGNIHYNNYGYVGNNGNIGAENVGIILSAILIT